ncbi:MAG TPA: DUF177 domain-containing protein [Chloroflexota bacterium]|nr:DUF177 domain-containing protein [Chloroflexota bacterium]
MTLQFNVSQLLKSEVGDTRAYDFRGDEPIHLGDEGTARDVEGHVKFTFTNFGVLADVRARAVLELTCARCLEEFDWPADVHFEEEYQPSVDIATGLPSTAPKNEDAFSIPQNHTIDLAEAIRQNLLLTIELIPVCRADCRGLCPECGVNRNVEDCRCAPDDTASPFVVLERLLTESTVE